MEVVAKEATERMNATAATVAGTTTEVAVATMATVKQAELLPVHALRAFPMIARPRRRVLAVTLLHGAQQWTVVAPTMIKTKKKWNQNPWSLLRVQNKAGISNDYPKENVDDREDAQHANQNTRI
ncbi:hypothetical protein F444_16535 [Phytophthora nicotianae P1976]|uniref:Uncharacterized protein n=1 Tax=Phytophthora nicotianae P1976 TaxID=1317066 RepID=A0A080ZHW1_PHYNI|nr:hypothetical protein F444_16535 [Phytophthora nicotianae P1976]